MIDGADKVTRLFDGWPSFHDAEVTAITLDRSKTGDMRGPTVTLSLHAFEMTDKVDSAGHFILRNHVLVTLVLYSAEVLHLDGFNYQNVLFALHVSKPETPLADDLNVQLDLESSFGVAASFQCARAEVVSVAPFDPQ